MKKKGFSQRGLGSYVPAHLNDKPFYEPIIIRPSDSVNEQFQKKTTSNRDLLSNAIEDTVQNDDEKNMLTRYKEQIDFSLMVSSGNIM